MAERDDQPSDLVPVAAFGVSTVAAIGLAIVYWQGGQTQAEGILLFLALGGIGTGLVSWARRFMPDEEVVEDRGVLPSSPDEIDALVGDVTPPATDAGGLSRRSLLTKAMIASFVALGGAALFPIRSLGPRPGSGLKSTPYEKGNLRLVDEQGNPVSIDTIALNGVLTVFPEGFVGLEDAQTLLIHTEEGELAAPAPDRKGWTVKGHIAFSKVCTHAGCPVGLFEEKQNLLLCPCHQSTFDVTQAAEPIFGPATRPLPQLPLALDDDDNFIATGDFSAPIGPGFWDRDR